MEGPDRSKVGSPGVNSMRENMRTQSSRLECVPSSRDEGGVDENSKEFQRGNILEK